MQRSIMLKLVGGLLALSQVGCAGLLVGAGAAGAATAYEASNKNKLEKLDDDLANGRVSRADYETRKDQIKDNSLVY